MTKLSKLEILIGQNPAQKIEHNGGALIRPNYGHKEIWDHLGTGQSNIFFVSREGKIIWSAHCSELTQDDPFVKIWLEGSLINSRTWFGKNYRIDPQTGECSYVGFSK